MASSFLKHIRHKSKQASAQIGPQKTPYEATHKALQTYELLEHILAFIDPRALKEARLVCSFWLTVISKNTTLDKRWKQTRYIVEIVLVVCCENMIRARDLVEAWCVDHVLESYDPTLEDSWRKRISVDGTTRMLTFLDYGCVNGQFQAMLEAGMAAGDAYVLVYSIDSRQSFDAVVQWQRALDSPTDPIHERMRLRRPSHPYSRPYDPTKPWLVGVIATSCEAEPERVEVEQREGVELARRLGCPFFGVSVSAERNIKGSLQELVREYVSRVFKEEGRKRQNAFERAAEDNPTRQSKRPSFWRRSLRKLQEG